LKHSVELFSNTLRRKLTTYCGYGRPRGVSLSLSTISFATDWCSRADTVEGSHKTLLQAFVSWTTVSRCYTESLTTYSNECSRNIDDIAAVINPKARHWLKIAIFFPS